MGFAFQTNLFRSEKMVSRTREPTRFHFINWLFVFHLGGPHCFFFNGLVFGARGLPPKTSNLGIGIKIVKEISK